LSLEEAFYLAFALDCLCISPVEELTASVSNPQRLSAQEAWRLFCAHKSTFPDVYAAYCYYRERGWMVKSGLKYATDLVLYRGSARSVHAQFAVCVHAEHYGGPIHQCAERQAHSSSGSGKRKSGEHGSVDVEPTNSDVNSDPAQKQTRASLAVSISFKEHMERIMEAAGAWGSVYERVCE
jgi:tRNA intron endonuclease, catalytic C-terminal domain